MFIIGELIASIAFLINGICQLLYILIIARIVVSWFPVDPYHSVVQFLIQVTEPILAPFRRIPLRIGMLDLTPFLAFVTLRFINVVTVTLLNNLAAQLGA